MRIAILAAAAAAWAGCAGAQESGVRWLHKPTSDQINALWPAEAWKRGIGGKAIVSCLITKAGLTTACKVVAEGPVNMGFGAAALQLTPSFHFIPAAKAGQAVDSEITIPVVFERAGYQGSIDPTKDLAPDPVYQARTALPWLQAPTSAQVAAAFPSKARGAATRGHVVLRCKLAKDGGLKNCTSVSEFPVRLGFTDAAKSLAPLFKADLERAGAPSQSLIIDLGIDLIDPAAPDWTARGVTKPMWLQTVNPKAAEAFYPQQALATGVTTGRGFASCTVDEAGRLTQCQASGEEPKGVGFGDAAAKIASLFVMNRWTGDGLPVDGQKVVLPVRLEAPIEGKPK